MNPFTVIEKLINEHGSATILGERLLLLKEVLAQVEKERGQLAAKCRELEHQVADLREQLAKATIPPDMTEDSGALFKRDSSGRYAPLALCPECRRPMINSEPMVFPYICTTRNCRYKVDIREALQMIADRLTRTRGQG